MLMNETMESYSITFILAKQMQWKLLQGDMVKSPLNLL